MQTLTSLRKSKQVKKQGLMELLGVTWPTYIKYEADPENTMTLAQINKVLEFLGEEPVHIFLSDDPN